MTRFRLRAAALPIAIVICVSLFPCATYGQSHGAPKAHPPLSAADVDAIARLEMLEDQREFDAADLERIFGDSHPELRRRAALAIARIADKSGIALLRSRPLDADTAVAATVVFAVGQLKDTNTVAWFDSLLSSPRTPPTVATEAAVALGKFKTGGARAVLGRYLLGVASGPRTNGTIAEALLSIGRANPRGDLAPILKWVRAPSEELRWRAIWALFRPHDPAAVVTLFAATKDPSGLVRSWAVRGIVRVPADSSAVGAAAAEARLLALIHDPDRRVRTEAVRSLASYSDSAAVAALVAGLDASDSWISISAAEGLGRERSAPTIPKLLADTAGSHPCALRITAMQSLQPFAPADARAVASALARDTVSYCRAAGLQAVMRDTSRTLAERRADVASPDPVGRLAAVRAMSAWADTSDLPGLLNLYDKTQNDSSPATAGRPRRRSRAFSVASASARRSSSLGSGRRRTWRCAAT